MPPDIFERSAVRAAIAVVALLAALSQAPAYAADGPLEVDVSKCVLRPRHLIQLGSPVFGLLARVFVDRADTVKQGQVLAKLDTGVEEAQVALDRTRAGNTTPIEASRVDLAWNQRELDRRQKLAGNMFSKANDIDEYVTKVEQDRIAIRKAETDLQTARQEADRSQAQLDQKILRSPVNGVVTDIKLSPGEFIYEQTPIMMIAEIDPLIVDLVVPADRYGAVRPGMIGIVHLRLPVNNDVAATVDAIDPVIDAASDTFRVRLSLPNPGNTVPAGVRCAVTLPPLVEGD